MVLLSQVQDLASMFAGRFNAVVRADPRSGYSTASRACSMRIYRCFELGKKRMAAKEKKNDGSFKRPGLRLFMSFCSMKALKSASTAERFRRGTTRRWLLGAGFEASALFDRNKCMARPSRICLEADVD